MPTTITITGTNANQYTIDTSSLSPFSNVVITDSLGQTETVTLTLSAPSHGALSNLGGGSYNAATGMYTVTGTAAEVTAALDNLVFSPTVADQALKTTFAIRVADSAGHTAFNNGTTVTSAQPITIATNGLTTLASLGNPNGANDTYIVENTSGSVIEFLTYNGSPVTVDEFGTWTPVAAKQTGTGYEVVLSNGANDYVVWNLNSSGAFTGGAAGVESTDVAALEANFAEGNHGEFLGSSTPPATPSTIASNSTTTLASIGSFFELNPAGGGTGPLLEYQGKFVTTGQFGVGWAPVGAVQTGTGYEVAWANTSANEYTIWNAGSNGDYTNSATGILSSANSTQAGELEALEANFGENFAGLTPATPSTLANNGTTILAADGNLFELNPAAGGTGPLLELNGSVVTAGQFAAGWTPVGAIWTGAGYEVAFSVPGANEYEVWNTDSGGDYTNSATGILSSTNPTQAQELEALEANFDESFAGLTPATATTIANNGTTILAADENLFELLPAAGGLGPLLELNGSAVTAAQFAAGWTPIGAVKTATGYEVAFSAPSAGGTEYEVWNTNSNGDYTSAATGILSGTSYALEELEVTFNENLNGDGTIGPTTTAIGTNNALAQVANQFELDPSASGPFVELNGSAVTVGQFAAGWTPVGAVATATGYEVAFAVLDANEYEVWNVNSSGDYTGAATGVLSGTSSELEGVEAAFGETFTDAGTAATPIPIGTNNQLAAVGNVFELIPAVGGTGPLLELNGGVVTSTQFAAGWTPVGAKQTGDGYEVVFSAAGGTEFEVWDTDAGGDYTGAGTGILSGTSPTLEAVEANFDETFSGGGPAATTTTIASNSTTTLAEVGNTLFELNPTSGGTGPLLELNGSVVSAGQFPAGWTPVAAQQTGTGYEVALSAPSASGTEYEVWNTDSNGDYTSAATGILTSTNSASTLEGLEADFGENFAGLTPSTPVTLANNGTTTLAQVGDLYELIPDSGGAATLLEYQGSAVTVGEYGDVTPVGALKTATGYEVAWSLVGQDQYTVWNTDSGGDYTSSALGVVTGQNFNLEDLDPTFGENLNDAPSLSAVLVTTANSSGAVNLSTQTQNTTINLGANSASAPGGLSGASSTVNNTPFAITLGSDPDIVEYALSPSSGIETIANFTSLDELNIAMRGAANSTLQMTDTMLGSTPAIAIYSSTDPAHGVLLLNPTETIAQLHTSFGGNHALITVT
jgi:Tryptophan-rich Synechocystis species C-terminal domain